MSLNREIARALVTRLQSSGHAEAKILDIASGSGEPACTIARILPSAEVPTIPPACSVHSCFALKVTAALNLYGDCDCILSALVPCLDILVHSKMKIAKLLGVQ